MNKETILTCLIIDKGHPYNNSYDLCKILSWKFGIINCQEIINDIINDEFAVGNYDKGIGYFKLNEKGKSILVNKKQETIEYLIQHFPDQKTFIEEL